MKRFLILSVCFLTATSFAAPSAISKLKLSPGIEATVSQGPLKVQPGSSAVSYRKDGHTLLVTIPDNSRKPAWWKRWFFAKQIKHYKVKISMPELNSLRVEKASTVKLNNFKIHALQVDTLAANFKMQANTKINLSYINSKLTTNLLGGSITKFAVTGPVDFSAKNLMFNNLLFKTSHSSASIHGNGSVDRLQIKPKNIFIAINKAKISSVVVKGNVIFMGDSLTADSLSFKANKIAGLNLNAKHLDIPSLTWQSNRLDCLLSSGQVMRASATGPVMLSGHNLHGSNLQLIGASGKLNIKGSNFNLLDLKLSHKNTSAVLSNGELNSLATTGHAKASLNHVQYPAHAMNIKAANVANLDLVGQGFISKLSVSAAGINMGVEHGKLSDVKLKGHAKFIATDMQSKALSAGSQRDNLQVAGKYHIKKLQLSNTASDLQVNANALFTKINLHNNATVFGKAMRAQHGMQVNTAADGKLVLMGNVTMTETKSPKGGVSVDLSDGTIQQLMVRGNVNVHGRDIFSKDLELKVKSHAAVDLDGQIGLKTVVANNSGPIKLQVALSKDLQIIESGTSHLYLSGNVSSLKVNLRGHSVLMAPYLRVNDALVRTEGAAQANVFVLDALRAFAYNSSNIYYYTVPKHLTLDPNQHGNVLHVYSKRSREMMFSKPSKGFGDQM